MFIRSLVSCLVLFLLAGTTLAASPARSEQALRILREASAVLRATTTIAFDFDYIGSGTQVGRARGSAAIRREPSGKLTAYRGEVELVAVFPGWEEHPARYDLGLTDGTAWRLDQSRRLLEKGTVSDGAGYLVNRGAGFFLFPQLSREEPLGVEIEDPEEIELLGTATLGGVECDLISLTFPPDSGLGSQLFAIAREDRLVRRIVFMAAGGAAGSLFTWDLTLTNLRAGDDAAPTGFGPPVADGIRVVDRDAAPVGPGDHTEGWSVTLAGGKTLTADDLLGRYIVLDFWASWCPFCHENLPYLDTLHRQLGDNPKIRIIAVNIWETSYDAAGYFEAQGFDMDLALDGDRLAEHFKVAGTPMAIVIGPDGRILLRNRDTGESRDRVLREALGP